MKGNLIVLLGGIVVLLTGCKAILARMYGLKQPEYESYDTINKFQEEIGFGDVPFSGLKAEGWFVLKNISTVELYVFNKEGKYIPYKDSLKPNCNGPAELFVSELKRGKVYHFSDEFTLDTFTNMLEGAQCQPLSYSKKQDIDFYVFITYASFAGKRLFKEKSKIWLDSLRSNKNINYQLTMLNMDFKDCWTQEQRALFEVKK